APAPARPDPQGAELVPRCEPARALLGRGPRLSPHRADHDGVRALRSVADRARGGSRRALRSPPAPPSCAGRGPRGARARDGDRTALRRAANEALRALSRRDATADTRRLVRGLELLRDALGEPAERLPAALAERFVAHGEHDAFVTGYHEPLLDARRVQDGRF